MARSARAIPATMDDDGRESKDESEAPPYCCDSQDCEDCPGCEIFLLPLLAFYFIFLFLEATVMVGEHRLWRLPSDYRPTEDDRDATLGAYVFPLVAIIATLTVAYASDIGVGEATRAAVVPYLWAACGVCFLLPLPRALVLWRLTRKNSLAEKEGRLSLGAKALSRKASSFLVGEPAAAPPPAPSDVELGNAAVA